jgi:hypothetical protein
MLSCRGGVKTTKISHQEKDGYLFPPLTSIEIIHYLPNFLSCSVLFCSGCAADAGVETTLLPTLKIHFHFYHYDTLYICWLQNREIYISGTAPYSTGTGYSTSTVRLQSWYCPTLFCQSIVFHFSDGLHYICLMFPDR